MPPIPIQPVTAAAELQVPPLGAGVEQSGGTGFGEALGDAVQRLGELQTRADASSQALALGNASDIVAVTMDVERANLALQLAVQVRNRAVDAYHEIFRMQV
jgi:flagellar hook-basal body complex protein FliE